MNDKSKELCHWGIELGAKRDNHKYIARVETKPGKYIYFYDMNKYNAWKNGAKNKVQNTAKSIKNKAEKTGERIQSQVSSKVNNISQQSKDILKNGNVKLNAAVNKYKKYVMAQSNGLKEKAVDKVNDVTNAAKKQVETASKKAKKIATEKVNELLNTKEVKEAQSIANKYMNKAIAETKNFLKTDTGKEVLKVIDKINKTANRKLINYDNLVEKPKKTQPKYIEKDNEYYAKKYNLDPNDYEAIKEAKMREYKENEPSFMHDVKRIEPDADGNYPTIKENIEAVNPGYKKVPEASVNCFHCSTAYDLRKRGYDVSAAAAASRFSGGASLNTFYDIEQTYTDNFGKGDATELEVQRLILELGKHGVDDRIAKDYNRHVNDSTEQKWQAAASNGEIFCKGGSTDNKNNTISIVPSNAIANYAKSNDQASLTNIISNRNERAKAIGNALTEAADSYPNNTWGRVGVSWGGGGGHSFVWEKDADGTVRFIDAQTNKILDIENYAKSCSLYDTIDLIRTDNLDIKPTVMWFCDDKNPDDKNTNKFEDQVSEKKGAK